MKRRTFTHTFPQEAIGPLPLYILKVSPREEQLTPSQTLPGAEID